MSVEQHKATIRQFVRPWNTGDVAILDEVCASRTTSFMGLVACRN